VQLAIKATGEGAKMLSFLLSKNPQNLYDRMEKGHRVRFTYTVFSDSEVEAVIGGGAHGEGATSCPETILRSKSQGRLYFTDPNLGFLILL